MAVALPVAARCGMIVAVEGRSETDAARQAYEAAFRRDGLPMLIEDYSPSYDVFTRAVPLLGLVLVLKLLRVATAIASFTGLYFAISMLTDDLYRREFLDRITGEMKQTFARRSEYLALVGEDEGTGGTAA